MKGKAVRVPGNTNQEATSVRLPSRPFPVQAKSKSTLHPEKESTHQGQQATRPPRLSRNFGDVSVFPPEKTGKESPSLLTGPLQMQTAGTTGSNGTGMPGRIKAGMEQISGMDLSAVRVHYNSSKPAELNALAYTQGQDIEVGPGQEQHLPHELWHVVQQRQGRVQSTTQMKGVGINDGKGLEHEADVMGAKALKMERSGRSDGGGLTESSPEQSSFHTHSHTNPSYSAQSAHNESTAIQKKADSSGAGVIQLKTCKHCGYENGHASNCTPETRQAATQERVDANRAAADQSMDERRRRDQSHPHHGNKNIKRAWKKR